ncbi:hypothetical protein ZHAS_00011200 [Anopheles sinensis]|uniref:Uncharacterized protein n=1 Tax=Anopheles sinensis TaxID=74873 RepID=A0A084VZK9_ANOSI|nr:hypothetical protein ZHAS_00011200 [Anopheles sinensis]
MCHRSTRYSEHLRTAHIVNRLARLATADRRRKYQDSPMAPFTLSAGFISHGRAGDRDRDRVAGPVTAWCAIDADWPWPRVESDGKDDAGVSGAFRQHRGKLFPKLHKVLVRDEGSGEKRVFGAKYGVGKATTEAMGNGLTFEDELEWSNTVEENNTAKGKKRLTAGRPKRERTFRYCWNSKCGNKPAGKARSGAEN